MDMTRSSSREPVVLDYKVREHRPERRSVGRCSCLTVDLYDLISGRDRAAGGRIVNGSLLCKSTGEESSKSQKLHRFERRVIGRQESFLRKLEVKYGIGALYSS